ncbi:uncharacterized protein LAJ45_09965 [Morchella importuna]|uniref:uncharacterized protein n=1 Tax=Morchella importuna TaxID=1174673 RepID=UPI001E8CB9B9|nr:uncharacterized protein LAJ45_09965 [Morchella importuna]KAH8146043.1 hypothetical protein LAJ45_09965 [Morchella importuna]
MISKRQRATRLFTEVQAAYEVISDPQERAWYDSHRDAILRNDDVGGGGGGGAGGSGGVTSVTTTEDVMRWFSMFGRKLSYEPSHPQSFFVVVGQAFAKLAEEEVAAAEWEGLDPVNYPGFGGANSGYADWVKAFYVEWGNFRTAKTFSWCDVYRYSDAPDRRVKRMMEAENKKLRDAAIREFNDIVRSFVTFVRKRDPRYTPNNQTEKQRQEALLAASKEQAARQRAENAAKLRNYKAADWTNVPEHAFDELYDSESDDDNAADEDGEEQAEEDEEEEEGEEELEEEPRRYECIVCKKVFAKEGPMLDHERSQKHAKAVWELKKQMRKENKEFDLDRDVRGWKKPEEFKPIDDDDEDGEEYLSAEEEEEEDGLPADEEKAKSPKEEKGEPKKPLEPTSTPTANTKPPTTTSPTPSEEEDSDLDNDDYVSTAAFTARLRGATTPPTSDLSNLTLTTNSDDDGSSKPAAQKLGKAKAKKAKRAAAAAEEKGGKPNTCAVCKQSFPSNTKMFNHLRDNPSHAVPVAGAGGAGVGGGGSGGGKKGKGKGKGKK